MFVDDSTLTSVKPTSTVATLAPSPVLARPQKYTARLEEKIIHNAKFVQYQFELTEPHLMEFQAGQYVSIKVSDKGERRSYSICSTPDVKHGFELLVDIEPQGLGCRYLESLKFGDQLEFLGPLGRFVLPPKISEAQLVFVATGSGITPFRSMILNLLQVQHETRPITLYWGLRHDDQLFWSEEWLELVAAFPNFSFHPVISQASGVWNLCRGRVTDCLRIHQLSTQAGYYLCGSDKMIQDVQTLLSEKQVLAAQIYHEKFY